MSAATFQQVFRENARYVWRSLVHFGVPERDAEDACQEVFVVVHRQLSAGEQPAQLRAWLYAIAWRVAAAHRRKAHRKREVPSDAPDAPISGHEPARMVEERRRLQQLDQALETLSDEQRAVFVLYEIEQLTMREIGTVLECSINTAFSRLYAARRRVASALGVVVPEEVWKR